MISEWTVDVYLVVIVCVALSVTPVNGGALRDVFAERHVRQQHGEMESGTSDGEATHVAANDLCRNVCHFCRNVLGLRWTALCNMQCKPGGREYNACVTIWSVKEELQNMGY